MRIQVKTCALTMGSKCLASWVIGPTMGYTLIKDIKGIIHIIHKFVAFFWSTHWTIVLEMGKNSLCFTDVHVDLGLYVLKWTKIRP